MNKVFFLTGFMSLLLSLACPSYAMKRTCEADTDPWEIFVNEILAKKTELKLDWDDRADDRQDNDELSLSSNNDILRLAKAIKSKDGLTSFFLSCDCCTNKGASALAEALGSLRKLTKLFLELWPEQKIYGEPHTHDEDIDAEGSEAIIDAIKFLPLKELSLHLPLDDGSSKKLSELIEHSNTLNSLYIETLQYKEGAYFILKALADNKTITTLKFFFVDSQSLLALAEVIRNNRTIKTLTILDDYQGDLDDFSYRAFFCAIAANKTLTTLNLPFINRPYFSLHGVNQTPYDYNKIQIMTHAFKSNKYLTNLDIPWLYETPYLAHDDTDIIRLSFVLQIQPILNKNKAWPNVKFIAFAIYLPEMFSGFPSEIRRIILQKFSELSGAL